MLASQELLPTLQMTVYGPVETQDKGATHLVGDGDTIRVLGEITLLPRATR